MPVIYRKSNIYTVRPGDTVYSIARRFNSSVQEVIRVNHLFPPVTDLGVIYPGNVLVITGITTSGKVSYIVNAGDTMNRIAFRFSSFPDLIAGVNNIVNPNLIYPQQALNVPAFIYEIQTGDTLANISGKFGIPLYRIAWANQGRPGYQEDLIWPGYQLVLPLPTSRNIILWSPLPGTRVGNGQRIDGKARAFEANVLHQLRDVNGVVVSNERFTTTDIGAPAYGNFVSTLPFDQPPTANTGEIWVYTRSANDGSIQDLVRSRVNF